MTIFQVNIKYFCETWNNSSHELGRNIAIINKKRYEHIKRNLHAPTRTDKEY